MRLYYPECRRCATGRKGRVFIRRDEMHSEFLARGEKSRRPLNGHLNGLARWFMEPERKIGVARLSTGSEKSTLFPFPSRARPRCLPVDLSMRSTLPIYDGRFEFELNARVGGIVLPLPGLIVGLTKSSPDPH